MVQEFRSVGEHGVEAVYEDGTVVPLALRTDLRNHSPTGFSWGYGGSGPSQLALAMVAELYDDETALATYQRVKWDIVANMPHEWTLDADIVRAVVRLARKGPWYGWRERE